MDLTMIIVSHYDNFYLIDDSTQLTSSFVTTYCNKRTRLAFKKACIIVWQFYSYPKLFRNVAVNTQHVLTNASYTGRVDLGRFDQRPS